VGKHRILCYWPNIVLVRPDRLLGQLFQVLAEALIDAVNLGAHGFDVCLSDRARGLDIENDGLLRSIDRWGNRTGLLTGYDGRRAHNA